MCNTNEKNALFWSMCTLLFFGFDVETFKQSLFSFIPKKSYKFLVIFETTESCVRNWYSKAKSEIMYLECNIASLCIVLDELKMNSSDVNGFPCDTHIHTRSFCGRNAC